MTRTKPHSKAAGGPRRDWNCLSEINPPANPPMIPKMHNSQPQCCEKNSAPGCFISPAKMVYHWVML